MVSYSVSYHQSVIFTVLLSAMASVGQTRGGVPSLRSKRLVRLGAAVRGERRLAFLGHSTDIAQVLVTSVSLQNVSIYKLPSVTWAILGNPCCDFSDVVVA